MEWQLNSGNKWQEPICQYQGSSEQLHQTSVAVQKYSRISLLSRAV